MGKQVSLDDFGPELEETDSLQENDEDYEKFSSSLISKLISTINEDYVSVLLNYKEGGLDEKDAIDYIYIKPSQTERFVDSLVNSKEGDWIIIRDDDGNVTSMVKNSLSLSVVRFVSLKK